MNGKQIEGLCSWWDGNKILGSPEKVSVWILHKDETKDMLRFILLEASRGWSVCMCVWGLPCTLILVSPFCPHLWFPWNSVKTNIWKKKYFSKILWEIGIWNFLIPPPCNVENVCCHGMSLQGKLNLKPGCISIPGFQCTISQYVWLVQTVDQDFPK